LSNSETDGVVKSTLKFKRLRVILRLRSVTKPAMTTTTKQTATNNQKKS